MVPQLSKEQIQAELRRMVDHFRDELRAGMAKADERVRFGRASEMPEGFLEKWHDTLAEKYTEAEALYAQLYSFIDNA